MYSKQKLPIIGTASDWRNPKIHMNTAYTSGQFVKFTSLLEQKGSNPERFQLFLGSGLLADLLEADPSAIDREEFRKLIGLPPLTLRITVDYSLSLEQMIALGQYDSKNDDITAERFPVKGEGKKEVVVELVKYEENMSSDEVLADLDSKGLRPATHEELLAFGTAFPELQRKFPIVALGSVAEVYGLRYVLYLDGDDSRRRLGLGWFDDVWYAGYRFLAVRK